MAIRSPIVATLGHVDHGKTTLLDKIRGTAIVEKEPGRITQMIGCSFIPLDTIKNICGDLLKKMKIKIEIPGLLLLDSPGHEAFTSLRKRGSSIADLAILVIDATEGFQPQTDESLQFLKEFKTPFVVAATKIDKIQGWKAYPEKCFSESFAKQSNQTKDSLEKAVYNLVRQLSERGFDSDRFDRIADFKKNIGIVPCSGTTGEGVPELLMVLSGLSQHFLKEELETKEIGMGSILEIKEVRGLGITADVILYDGQMKRGDWLIIGGREPIATKIRALLKPKPLKEIRVEKEFENIDSVSAACGVKISAPDLDKAIAGSPIRIVTEKSDIESAERELKEEVEKVEFETSAEGVILRADTLGSLEALSHILQQRGLSVRRAGVGQPSRKDVMELESLADPFKKIIFAFNTQIPQDVLEEAKNRRIKILSSNIIYKLFEEYDSWVANEKERIKLEKLERITRPAKIKILPGFVFRQSKPAVVGVEIVSGVLKAGVALLKNGKEIGVVIEIQSEERTVEKAEKGERVAVSIEGPVVGRQINEGDELVVSVSKEDLKVLEELNMKEEIELAKETLGV